VSTRDVRIGIGGSEVRRMHLIALAAMLVVAVAAGMVIGSVGERGSSAAQATRVVLPLDRLADSGVGSRVFPAMNHLRPVPTEGLSDYSQFRRDTSLGWSPFPDRYLDDVRIVRGSAG
jgi:hypothetical protein